MYARGGDWYEIYDDHQVVKTLDLLWRREDTGLLSAEIVVKSMAALGWVERKTQQECLNYLIGYNLDKEASDRLGELTFTRRNLAAPRRHELKKRDHKFYSTEPWTTSSPVPKDLEEQVKRKHPITLHYVDKVSFIVHVELSAKPTVLLQYFALVMADQGLHYDADDDLALKVFGREEFISGDLALSSFLWVRHCLKSDQDIHLSVVSLSQLADDTVKLVDRPLIDDSSSRHCSHDELCLEGRNVDQILMISLWDCHRALRVKLLGFDIPKLPDRCPQTVSVKASILFGSKVLSSVCASPKAFADEVLWNEWLDFGVPLHDLPRGSKLGFTIHETPPVAKDTGAEQQKGNETLLYFVNLLLIDHRLVFIRVSLLIPFLMLIKNIKLLVCAPTGGSLSLVYFGLCQGSITCPACCKDLNLKTCSWLFLRSLLSQGPHTLHMWSNPNVEEGAIAYQADKLSTATNPDVDEAVAISFLLDHYSFPVALPSSSPPLSHGERHSSALTQNTPTPIPSPQSTIAPAVIVPSPMNPDQAPLRTCAPPGSTDTGIATDRLQRFQEENVLSVLPHYFRNVNWMNHKMVQDVHCLLANCNPEELDLTVALELLSMDFPDVMVRRLAVQRLESLSKDDILKYLLQLVQVCTVITKERRNTTLISSCPSNTQGCSVMSLNAEKWWLYILSEPSSANSMLPSSSFVSVYKSWRTTLVEFQ